MKKSTYRNYLLGVLVLVGTMTSFERFVFALALEPIKNDLHLSDSQLGLMTGIAFAAFYAVAGIPLARWADRGNRVTIAAIAVGLVSVMVSLCGVVSNFTQMLAVRAGIAIGEAGDMPSIQSLIADYFDRSERPRAMAIFFTAYPISMIVGYLVGGWLIESFGWRHTFIMLGVPGVLVAVLVKITLKEPRLTQQAIISPEKQPSVKFVLKTLWQQRTFRHIFIAFCISYFFSMGTSQWLATYFIRSHDMGMTELGTWLAISWGGFGFVGNYLGGHWTTAYLAHKEKWQMRAVALLSITYGALSVGVYLVEDKTLALVFLSLSAFFISTTNGAVFSALQSLVSDRMRAMTIAVLFLFANLIGFGLGPLALGITSDLLNPILGQESLRYALALSCPGLLWVAFHYWQAAKTIEADIREVEFKARAGSTETSAITQLEPARQCIGKEA